MDVSHLPTDPATPAPLRYDPHSALTPAQRIGQDLPQVDEWDLDWILTSAFMIVLMQFGFAALEAGCVRYKNVQSIIIKVALNTFVTVAIWWLVGYAFAFGNDYNNGFIGFTKFAGAGFEADSIYNDYANFVFQTACAAVAASIMSGGTAERMNFFAWTIVTIFFSGFIYTTGVHWTFGGGWLQRFGYHDFAGSGVIHLVGGTGALVALVILKPRANRFDPDYAYTFPAHSPVLASFGCFVLYTCWLFFNSGSLFPGHHDGYVQASAPLNTFIAGAFGGITSYFVTVFTTKDHGLIATMNGLLTALVCVTGDCDGIAPWAAALFGVIGGLVYHGVARALLKAKIDDPIDAVPVHFGGGLVGTLLTGLFDRDGGLFYGQGVTLFGVQLLAVIVYVAWSGALNGIVLSVLKGMGKLRVDPETELQGIDKTRCGGEATVFSNELPLEQAPKAPLYSSRVVAPAPISTVNPFGRPVTSAIYR